MSSSNEIVPDHGLVFEKAWKRFGGIQVLTDVSFTAPRNKVIGLIGPNGAGKTTLINLVCGVLKLDSGDIRLDGQSLCALSPCQVLRKGVVRTFQEARLFPFLTVLENVMVGLQNQKGETIFHGMLRTSAMRRDDRKQRERARYILEKLDLAYIANEPAGELAFGHKKLVGLARAIATGANVFLLDEPTAGVEPNMIKTVLEVIRDLSRKQNSVILIVEHNMDVIRDITDQIVVLMTRVIAKGPMAMVFQDDRVIRDYLGRIDFVP